MRAESPAPVLVCQNNGPQATMMRILYGIDLQGHSPIPWSIAYLVFLVWYGEGGRECKISEVSCVLRRETNHVQGGQSYLSVSPVWALGNGAASLNERPSQSFKLVGPWPRIYVSGEGGEF